MQVARFVVGCALACACVALLPLSAGGVGAGGAYLIPRPQLRADSMTLCGRHLAEARMLFCYEKGYSPKKKAIYSPIMNALVPRGYEDNMDSLRDGELEGSLMPLGWPWLESHRANSFTMDGRGKRQDGGGLVDECCYKPCTLNELLNYC